MAVMVGGLVWVWEWFGVGASTCVGVGFGGSKEQAKGRDCLWKLWWKSGNWRQYPPTELRGIVQWMGKGKEKWILLSLMVRLRGKGYDVACLPWKFSQREPFY